MTGLFGAIVCTPPYVTARPGLVLLTPGSTLFPLGVALLVTGLMLQAGATGAVKAIKVSAKLLAVRHPQVPASRAPPGPAGTGHNCATATRPRRPARPGPATRP